MPRDLELQELTNGKVLKPKVKFTFMLEQRGAVCEWVKGLKMFDDVTS